MKLVYWLIGIGIGLLAFEFVLWLLALLGMLHNHAGNEDV